MWVKEKLHEEALLTCLGGIEELPSSLEKLELLSSYTTLQGQAG